MAYQTFKGSQIDLVIYQGKSATDYPIEILDEDGEALSFTPYGSFVFKVYYRQHGDLIVTPTVTTTSNFILLDVTLAQSAALQTREYFYECYGVLTSPVNEQELLAYGIFKVA